MNRRDRGRKGAVDAVVYRRRDGSDERAKPRPSFAIVDVRRDLQNRGCELVRDLARPALDVDRATALGRCDPDNRRQPVGDEVLHVAHGQANQAIDGVLTVGDEPRRELVCREFLLG